MKIETIITKQQTDSWLDIALKCLEEHKYILESTLGDCQGREYDSQTYDIEEINKCINSLEEL